MSVYEKTLLLSSNDASSNQPASNTGWKERKLKFLRPALSRI